MVLACVGVTSRRQCGEASRVESNPIQSNVMQIRFNSIQSNPIEQSRTESRVSHPFFPSMSPPVCPFLGANSVPSLVFFDGCLADFLDCLLWLETRVPNERDDLADRAETALEDACKKYNAKGEKKKPERGE